MDSSFHHFDLLAGLVKDRCMLNVLTFSRESSHEVAFFFSNLGFCFSVVVDLGKALVLQRWYALWHSSMKKATQSTPLV